jgi:hypothetical protein
MLKKEFKIKRRKKKKEIIKINGMIAYEIKYEALKKKNK